MKKCHTQTDKQQAQYKILLHSIPQNFVCVPARYVQLFGSRNKRRAGVREREMNNKHMLCIICLICITTGKESSHFQNPEISNFTSGTITSYDAYVKNLPSGKKVGTIDSLIHEIDSVFFHNLTKNITDISEIKGYPVPEFLCGCGLAAISRINVILNDSSKISIVWSCPTSDFQNKMQIGSRNYIFKLKAGYVEQLRTKINKNRYNIFKKGSLFECLELNIDCEDK